MESQQLKQLGRYSVQFLLPVGQSLIAVGAAMVAIGLIINGRISVVQEVTNEKLKELPPREI